jgi:hypothetical protein
VGEAHGAFTTDSPLKVFYFLAAFLWTEYLLSGRFRDFTLASLAFAVAIVPNCPHSYRCRAS